MRVLVRVALYPVKVMLTLLEWAVLFVTHFVGIGCYLMAGGCFVLAVSGWVTGLDTAKMTVRTLGIGFTFFVVPLVGDRIVAAIALVKEWVLVHFW